tara:strand:+ start:266 stop:523 length:258 start_codon:yes stop_codon:yes gene_type:complete
MPTAEDVHINPYWRTTQMTQDINDKDITKMIIYLMDRTYPCRNLDALVEALAWQVENASNRHEYMGDWKYLLKMFRSVQIHNEEE